MTHTIPTVRADQYQVTFPETENAVSFIAMKRSNLADLGGGVIISIMAIAVFAGGASAYHHTAETVEYTSPELPQETDEKTEIEV